MSKSKTKTRTPQTKPPRPPTHRGLWDLVLYVAGQTPTSVIAIENLKRLCEEHPQGKYRLRIIDLLEHPQFAKDDQIMAIPTLVRRLPKPIKTIIGDLSNTERVLMGLEFLPRT